MLQFHLRPPQIGLDLTVIVEFLFSLLISPPISRHLNGSDLSSASFWLRVALGSAVVTVLGFAVYRTVVRLKWPPIDWTLFHPPTPPHPTPPWRPNLWDQTHQMKTPHTSNSLSSFSIQFYWKPVIMMFSFLLCSALLPYFVQKGTHRKLRSAQVLSRRAANAGQLSLTCCIALSELLAEPLRSHRCSLESAKWIRPKNQRAAHSSFLTSVILIWAFCYFSPTSGFLIKHL